MSNFIIYLIKNNKKENFNYGIYNFTGKGNKTSWYKIAKIIEETFKKNKIKFAKIRPISTNELNQLAQRPYNALLDNNKFYVNFKFTQNNWKKNLENVLNKILL